MKIFTISGRGGHHGHVTLTIYIDCRSPFLRRLHITLALIGQAVSVEKNFENSSHIHVFSPEAGADNPLGQIFFINSIIQSV